MRVGTYVYHIEDEFLCGKGHLRLLFRSARYRGGGLAFVGFCFYVSGCYGVWFYSEKSCVVVCVSSG